MKIGITHRLFLAILAAAGLAVIGMFLIMQWNIERGFRRYVVSQEQAQLTRLAERLEEGYAGRENWNFLKNDPDEWHRLIAASFPHEQPGPPDREQRMPPWRGYTPEPHGEPGARPAPPPPPRGFGERFFLLDAAKVPLLAPAGVPAAAELKPLHNRERVVGYLGLLPHKRFSDERQVRFLKEQRFALALVAGAVVLLAAGLSLPLANRLVRPIKALAAATRQLAAGRFDARVPVASTDELGQLARDFNSLAHTLENNEQARRQWVADISHELRTPLAVLRGEIEALQDGIRRPTPEAISSLHGETLRLARLVEDLYQLSLSDLGALTYKKRELDCAPILSQALESFRPEFSAKGIALASELGDGSGNPLFADGERLRQLFDNLLENSLKYTDSRGKLLVRLEYANNGAVIHFQDSGPGVPPEALGHIFERLYRVEASRNLATGGAGLGLAICANIVAAHDGAIHGMDSPLGGLWIKVTLPLTGRMA